MFKQVKYTNNTWERNTTNKCIYIFVNLLYYKWHSLLYIYNKYIYISVNALVGHIYHNKSSVHGHESFKTYKKTSDEIIIMSQTQKRLTYFLSTLNKFHRVWKTLQIL